MVWVAVEEMIFRCFACMVGVVLFSLCVVFLGGSCSSRWFFKWFKSLWVVWGGSGGIGGLDFGVGDLGVLGGSEWWFMGFGWFFN